MGNCFAAEESVVSDEEKNNSLRRNMLRSRRDDDVYKYYEVIKNLGEGSLGAVSSARKKAVGGSAYTEIKQFGIFTVKKKKDSPLMSTSSEHQREYALKSIQLGRVSAEFLDEMRNEIDILRTLDHPTNRDPYCFLDISYSPALQPGRDVRNFFCFR